MAGSLQLPDIDGTLNTLKDQIEYLMKRLRSATEKSRKEESAQSPANEEVESLREENAILRKRIARREESIKKVEDELHGLKQRVSDTDCSRSLCLAVAWSHLHNGRVGLILLTLIRFSADARSCVEATRRQI